MEKDFSFFFDWQNFKDMPMYTRMFNEFADNGEKNIVLTEHMLDKFIDDPSYRYYFNIYLKKAGLQFSGCHGLFKYQYDLNCADRHYRPQMIEKHKTAMGYAADSGCKSYVVHVGAACTYFEEYDLQKMRDLACDTLEKLIPTAEKEGIVIAVENSFEPTNTADEVLYYMKKFPSPAVGACYDSGHANIMKSTDKKQESYSGSLKMCWKNNIVFEDETLEKMTPYIVTCHLHDNNGYGDFHQLPETGTTDWQNIISKLAKCPRIQNMQIEVSMSAEISIRKLIESANKLKKYI